MNHNKTTQGLVSINVGSSSVKFSVYALENKGRKPILLSRGIVDGLQGAPVLTTSDQNHRIIQSENISARDDLKAVFAYVYQWITKTYPDLNVVGVGHRVVHGGTIYSHPVLINESVLRNLKMLSPMVPQHQPYCLLGIHVCQTILPGVPQIACFDTSFHTTLPFLETLFGLPRKLWGEGIRRYGFHGLSYQYIADRLPDVIGQKAKGKVIVAHLGHGASLCALKDLKSMATTMGFSALDGLAMGTRCGSIDPGVLLYLLNERNYSLEDIETLLYKNSGLLGLSGISDDMRELLTSKSPQAKDAIDYFCYRLQKEMGSLTALLEGIDVIVFTGGIGENVPLIRANVCDKFQWLNVKIDHHLNSHSKRGTPFQISSHSSQVSVWVIPTDEEFVIAQGIAQILPC